MTRYCLVGPTYPYRGGIAHYTTLLTQNLRQTEEVLLISFSRQYPSWLFPGRGDKDPSERPLRTETEYLLDSLNPITWWQTIRRIREWQPDVVIIPWWVPFWAPCWHIIGRAVKRMKFAPQLIFICHNVLPHEGSILDRTLLRFALNSGDGFLVHDAPDKERLLAQFPNAQVVVSSLPTYAALGQNVEQAQSLHLPQYEYPVVLFFGLVRPYKGVDILLEAMALVERPLHLIVAGEFWQDEKETLTQIERLNLANRVTIINKYLPDEEVALLMKKSSVVVLPYRSATQSAVVQVAFGYEKPVITTDVGGLAEAVENGRTGLVVPPENPPALAEAIERFFAEELSERFVENIRDENGRFSWHALIQTIQSLEKS